MRFIIIHKKILEDTVINGHPRMCRKKMAYTQYNIYLAIRAFNAKLLFEKVDYRDFLVQK